MTPPDHLTIETPENIRFGYEVADLGSRFLAILIDSLIQGTLYVFIFFLFALLSVPFSSLNLPPGVSPWLGVIFLIVLFIIQFGYFMFFEIITGGQTPGKRLFGLRVIKDNGYPLTPLDSVIRNLIRIIDFFPVAYGVGVIAMFANPRAKRLGDYAAGTLVVKMRDQVKLADLRAPALSHAPAPVAPAPVAPVSGLERLTEADIALAESFLARRAQLSNPAALGLEIARRLRAKLDLDQANPIANETDAAAFLRALVHAYRTPRG